MLNGARETKKMLDALNDIQKRAKPQTNADRIRGMSDEELAKVLNAFVAYFEECNRSHEIDCHDCELCEICSLREGKALKWLQQPAEA